MINELFKGLRFNIFRLYFSDLIFDMDFFNGVKDLNKVGYYFISLVFIFIILF